jgi:hypothetical protein
VFKNIFIFSLLGFLLQSCQSIDIVIAQSDGELNFEIHKNWDYAVKVTPPGMIEQVRKENIDSDWIGDPRRFPVLKIQNFAQKTPFYLISPTIECPERGCDMSYNLPLCGGSGGCTYLGYIEKNGVYKKVFDKLFWLQGSDNPNVSKQLKEGLPACLELPGYDFEARERGLPQQKEDQRFVSRYCYNGKNYVLNRLYLVPIPKKEQ